MEEVKGKVSAMVTDELDKKNPKEISKAEVNVPVHVKKEKLKAAKVLRKDSVKETPEEREKRLEEEAKEEIKF